jgi:UDP-N-acetylglucosamine 2-epimerase
MSMKKLKVMSVVGTRPEIIRLSRVLAALDEHCEHVLVHTGQNYDYELNQVFFDDLGVRKPDYFLNSAEGSTGAAHTIGNLIIAVDRVLGEVQPEAMLVLGDTNSCLSVIPAKRRKIRSSTWKRATAASTSGYRKRPTAASSTTRRHQPHVQHHRARLPAARGPAARPGDQDR